MLVGRNQRFRPITIHHCLAKLMSDHLLIYKPRTSPLNKAQGQESVVMVVYI